MSLETVYASIRIISTVGSSLEIDVYRDGKKLPTPTIAKQPDFNRSRTDFLARTLVNLAAGGNAFWRIYRNNRGEAQNIECLDPNAVSVRFSVDNKKKFYDYTAADGNTYELGEKDVEHLRLNQLPGHVLGLGPLQLCRVGVMGALALRNHTTTFTKEMPNGILKSDQTLDAESAAAYQEAVYSQLDNGGILVLGNGLQFQTVQFSPQDLQFLENRKFNDSRISTMFGVPPFYLNVDEGSSSYTYTSLNQINQVFYTTCLAQYLNVMEAAFSLILPRGQEAKFNLDSLLRSDERTRAEVDAINIASGVTTVDEIRERDGKEPLPKPEPVAAPPAVEQEVTSDEDL